MFLLLALPAVVSARPARARRDLPGWIAVGVVLLLFIGFRHEVGGDWGNYIGRFMMYQRHDLGSVLLQSDPGYAYLNWQLGQWGFGMYAVNMVCAVFFTVGLMVFARQQPYPWLALAVAFPYLIMVVGMGYTRQGVAIGFILLALTALQHRRFIPYLAFIALATLFHRTALVMIPLGFFLFGRGWAFRAIAIVTAAYVLYDSLVAEEADKLWESYVEQGMVSQGAQIRVLMNLVPSLLLLGSWRTWRRWFPDYWFWFWIAASSVASIFLVGFASTAADRIALYFLPIQLVVLSRLPLIWRRRADPTLVRFGIVVGYALVLYVWLNYAVHANAWVPYRNLLFLS